MPVTSGAINTVTITRDQLITDVLEDLRVFDPTGSPNSKDIASCAFKLNMLIKRLQIKGLYLWCRDTIVVPLVGAQTSYTIGPTGNVVTYRPLRALDGTFIRQVVGSTTQDTSLQLLSRLEYEQESAKQTQGVVNSFYYDPQMGTTASYNPANSNGILNLYVTPSDNTRTVYLEVQRPIQDMTAGNQSFDFPLEWYSALSRGLAAEVVDKFEVPEQRVLRVKKEGQEALDELADWGATEPAPFHFEPDAQFTMNGRGYA